MRTRAQAFALTAAIGFALFPLGAQERVDEAAINRIIAEATERSQVMTVMSWLTDVHGPRLTGSPQSRRAGEWAMQWLRAAGATNVAMETFPFGRGWTNEKTYVQVTAPVPFSVIAYPGAWTPGTRGLVSGEVSIVQIDSAGDFAKYRGQLRGKVVLMGTYRDVGPNVQANMRRYTDAELEALADLPRPAVAPAGGGRGGAAGAGGRGGAAAGAAAGGGRGGAQPINPILNAAQLRTARAQFLADEGVLAVLEPARGDGGTVFISTSAAVGGSRDKANPTVVPALAVAVEHWGRMYRQVQLGVPVRIELDVRNTFHDDDENSFNIVGELRGSDKADEIVMLGAHFDSWHAGTGATDNAAGSAIMMEAMRILKATGLPLRRTVRIGLWTGEEQGLIGSREYVSAHFGDRATQVMKPDHAKFSAYFNVDNGTGKIRGVYQQGNEAAGPVFDAWMKPFNARGMRTLTLANTGGTDHQSFDAVGLPGFQFIQDPAEYSTRTHHSNQDTFERVQAEDMKHNAAVLAAFVYLAANRPELFPRKPAVQ
jgi:carboxypeptidase Q